MTIHLIRHAHAGSRANWDGPDDQRPLSDRGIAQAKAIAANLADAGIEVLWTSPSLRCRQTMEPLAELIDRTVEVSEPFDEGGYGSVALDAILSAYGDGRTIAACSHGDVIPDLVATAVRRGATLTGSRVIHKGGRYECTVVDGQIAGIVAIDAPDRD